MTSAFSTHASHLCALRYSAAAMLTASYIGVRAGVDDEEEAEGEGEEGEVDEVTTLTAEGADAGFAEESEVTEPVLPEATGVGA